MAYYLIKIAVTTGLIVAISEVAKRNSLMGAILASIPIVSVLAMCWFYVDTKDTSKISTFSISIFLLTLPSLALFISLPCLLRCGMNFYLAILTSIGLTAMCYYTMIMILSHFGIKL